MIKKPLQDRMNLTIDELKELEPEFANVIEDVRSEAKCERPSDFLLRDIDWALTKLYLAAYHRGYLRGCSDERIATDEQWVKAALPVEALRIDKTEE